MIKNSSRFFANRDCEYYPCHKGISDLNCLFCYCPFYGEDKCPGKPSWIYRGDYVIKDCTDCIWPHRPENYDSIVRWIIQKNKKRKAPMKRKIIFLDIDGTMTDFTGHMPDSAAEALKKAKANGHELVICSGRTITQIYPWLSESGLFAGIVCASGADVRYNGEIVSSHFIDREHLKHIVSYMESTGAFYYLQCQSGVYATERVVSNAGQLFAGMPSDEKERERLFGKMTVTEDPASLTDVNKMAYYQADADIGTIRREAGDYFDVMEASFRLTEKSDGEITIRGVDKAYGMREFLKAAGGSMEDTIAFGDGPNDYDMIEAAGTGVAMGNAVAGLKEEADMVTTDIGRDGLANAFEKLGLV